MEDLRQLFFSDQLDPTSPNSTTSTPPLESISSVDALLSQENTANLVGIETRHTDSELHTIEEEDFCDLIKTPQTLMIL